jgi:hypothetical protein
MKNILWIDDSYDGINDMAEGFIKQTKDDMIDGEQTRHYWLKVGNHYKTVYSNPAKKLNITANGLITEVVDISSIDNISNFSEKVINVMDNYKERFDIIMLDLCLFKSDEALSEEILSMTLYRVLTKINNYRVILYSMYCSENNFSERWIKMYSKIYKESISPMIYPRQVLSGRSKRYSKYYENKVIKEMSNG